MVQKGQKTGKEPFFELVETEGGWEWALFGGNGKALAICAITYKSRADAMQGMKNTVATCKTSPSVMVPARKPRSAAPPKEVAGEAARKKRDDGPSVGSVAEEEGNGATESISGPQVDVGSTNDNEGEEEESRGDHLSGHG